MIKRYDASFVKLCAICRAEFRVYAAHVRRGRNAQFCSRKCQGIAKSAVPSMATIIDCVCKECGKQFHMRRGSGGTGEFCSIGCMSSARGRDMRGENHPFWKGGVSERPHSERRLIKTLKKEIGCCEQCGATGNLHGHHILPFSVFKCEHGNKENIAILCATCHKAQHREIPNFMRSLNYG